MDERQLRQVYLNRSPRDRVSPLAVPLETLVHDRLARRVRQLGKLAGLWDECVPEDLLCHAALVSLVRGVLTVAVDSAPHRYQLQMLLQNGLLRILRDRFAGPLNRIRVVAGRFDWLDLPGTRWA